MTTETLEEMSDGSLMGQNPPSVQRERWLDWKLSRIFNFIIYSSVGPPDCEIKLSAFWEAGKSQNAIFTANKALFALWKCLPLQNSIHASSNSCHSVTGRAHLQGPLCTFQAGPKRGSLFCRRNLHIIPVCGLVAVVLLGSVGNKKYRNPQK